MRLIDTTTGQHITWDTEGEQSDTYHEQCNDPTYTSLDFDDVNCIEEMKAGEYRCLRCEQYMIAVEHVHIQVTASEHDHFI